MKLSKKEELLALGSALYLLGLEVEASRSELEKQVSQARAAGREVPDTQEFLHVLDTYNHASDEFAKLEKRFLQLKQEL